MSKNLQEEVSTLLKTFIIETIITDKTHSRDFRLHDMPLKLNFNRHINLPDLLLENEQQARKITSTTVF